MDRNARGSFPSRAEVQKETMMLVGTLCPPTHCGSLVRPTAPPVFVKSTPIAIGAGRAAIQAPQRWTSTSDRWRAGENHDKKGRKIPLRALVLREEGLVDVLREESLVDERGGGRE